MKFVKHASWSWSCAEIHALIIANKSGAQISEVEYNVKLS